jgi:hypothetical protein
LNVDCISAAPHGFLALCADIAPAIYVSETAELVLAEAGGGTATLSLVLSTRPAASVTLTVSSSDTTEGSIGGVIPLTFTRATWGTTQVVTITAVDDDDRDFDTSFTVTTAVSTDDSVYSALAVPDFSVTTTDGRTWLTVLF